MSAPIITLTSDFGPGLFVGLMKGVILGICPQARLVDLEHGIAAQDVMAGALVLEQALGVFPEGTVHLAVVDPGVGGARRAMVVRGAGCLWVGPDNGLFSAVLATDPGASCYELGDQGIFRQPISNTFHGRDIFAPAAAHLARGREASSMGRQISDPVRLDRPQPSQEGHALVGEVLMADRFGNLITNLERGQVERFLDGRPVAVRAAATAVFAISPSYDAVPPGETVALFNSTGRLELAVNQGSLLERLGLDPGNERGLGVRVERVE
ncbi:MAG: SAM-dependent chlorinase/fluorinase [Desulfarculaceae bacterium]|nr:SAM-dependent chlorinase/fluorinase [Desulfarculaceae bacterium]MCF8073411.1 SAM-dependent chlorinase/fluorinase [Desulfarculaceae bacterium]MCF8100442.1 SAM-dependent chlorinase/fluorinase [Desulfarculaceae bacterium]MCF8115822.1 SAM-dependent chlorinase/fluorinase [Desulfarculaceae bacterium]